VLDDPEALVGRCPPSPTTDHHPELTTTAEPSPLLIPKKAQDAREVLNDFRG